MTQYHSRLIQEQELIQKAQQDIRYFGELYQKFYRGVFSFVNRKIKNTEIAADITSHAFLKAMTKLNTYVCTGAPFSTWLYRIAYNEVVAYWRETNKKQEIDTNANELTFLSASTIDITTEDRIKQVLALLTKLSVRERELVELRFFQDKSFAEIASILGITEGTAKVRMFRIINTIKRYCK